MAASSTPEASFVLLESAMSLLARLRAIASRQERNSRSVDVRGIGERVAGK